MLLILNWWLGDIFDAVGVTDPRHWVNCSVWSAARTSENATPQHENCVKKNICCLPPKDTKLGRHHDCTPPTSEKVWRNDLCSSLGVCAPPHDDEIYSETFFSKRHLGNTASHPPATTWAALYLSKVDPVCHRDYSAAQHPASRRHTWACQRCPPWRRGTLYLVSFN